MIFSHTSRPKRLFATSIVTIVAITLATLSTPVQSIPVALDSRDDINSRSTVPFSPSTSSPTPFSGTVSESSSSFNKHTSKRAVIPNVVAAPPPSLSTPSGTPTKPAKVYDFNILNPEPNAVWVSGMLETVTWDATNLPAGATLDITLVPEDPETNPEAKLITRRPILRKIHAIKFYTDIIVPYTILTLNQLKQEQTGDGVNIEEFTQYPTTQEGGAIPPEALEELKHANETMAILHSNETPADISAHDFKTPVRLWISVYRGKTNQLLVQKSVFPVFVQKDHLRDLRTVLIDMAQLDDAKDGAMTPSNAGTQDEKVTAPVDGSADDSADDNNMHDGDDSDEEEDGENGDPTGDPTDGTGTGTGEHDHTGRAGEQHHHGQDGHDHGAGAGESGPTEAPKNGDMEEHGHDHEHDPSHVIDPNHFQNDEDIRIWKEMEDQPGVNPPIKVIQKGTINITRWIDNKDRFFVGAPYVMAWSFPEEGLGLTGYVNVYVEDAETAKRYDIVAGNLPSDVLFMYMHPTYVMVSSDPTRRIILRARVELDLMKDGDFHRYTAFSKPFWVERGAL